jgi:glycolate oxidase FAD binding subunit
MSSAIASQIAGKFEAVVGTDHVHTDTMMASLHQVDGLCPSFAVSPEDAQQAAEIVRLSVEANLSIIPFGARSAISLGMPPSKFDVALDMTRVVGVAHYDPGDLTVSVNAGMPLAELAKILADQNQFLPLAVPFYSTATIGGAIASGLDSPLRHFYGTARDFLIGAEFVDGTGALTKSGGRVVKNVTGYDFHKLLHGSLGSLAVITRLNFRTFPIPRARRGFLASFADNSRARRFVDDLSASSLTPTVVDEISPEFARLFLEGKSPVASLRLDTDAWTVCVGFEGSAAVCERYAKDLAAIARAASAQNAVTIHDAQWSALLEILREAPASLRKLAADAIVFRFATLPSQLHGLLHAVRSFASSSWMPHVTLVRSGCFVYLALLPRDGDDSNFKQVAYFWNSTGSLRGKLEFQAAILFCPAAWKRQLNVWAHATTDLDLHRRVKNAFDPAAIFAPGRFVGGI